MHLKLERTTVTRQKQGETEERMELLFKREYAKFYAFAVQLLGDEERSRDMVADAFEYAWSRAEGRGDAELRNLIFTVIHDRSIDLLRKRKVEQRYLDFYSTMLRIDGGETVDHKLAVIEQALATMQPKAQQMLRSCYHLHRTYDEVAADMHMSKSTLKVRLTEALKELCKKVKILNG